MKPDESGSPEEPVTRLLAALEDALTAEASRSASTGVGAAPDPEGDWVCLQLLRQVLSRRHTAGAAAPPPGLPFTSLGRFRIVRELGRGSFGIVFLALDPHLQREVALKVPRPEVLLTPELRERFVREARAAAGLDHPHLVAVHEAGAVGPLCYLASAYCPGITLAAWLKLRTQSVPVRLAAELVATLAAAVHHAHSRGVVHRDLKPANVLLETKQDELKTGGKERSSSSWFIPKITDFGLAKLTHDPPFGPGPGRGDQTASGAIVGTPHYMAPEQAGGKNKEVGPAADVYALGAILYELLTGAPPFRGETALEVLEQLRTCEPVAPRRLRPKVPRDLETVCLKCLTKPPHQRYASAAALADDLRRFLAGTPIQARPVRLWERGLKWARRRPAAALLVGMSSAAALLATRSNFALFLGMGSAAALTLGAVILRYTARLQQAAADLQRAHAATDQLRRQAEEQLQQTLRALEDRAANVIQDEPPRARRAADLRKELLQTLGLLYLQTRRPKEAEAALGKSLQLLAQPNEAEAARHGPALIARQRSV